MEATKRRPGHRRPPLPTATAHPQCDYRHTCSARGGGSADHDRYDPKWDNQEAQRLVDAMIGPPRRYVASMYRSSLSAVLPRDVAQLTDEFLVRLRSSKAGALLVHPVEWWLLGCRVRWGALNSRAVGSVVDGRGFRPSGFRASGRTSSSGGCCGRQHTRRSQPQPHSGNQDTRQPRMTAPEVWDSYNQRLKRVQSAPGHIRVSGAALSVHAGSSAQSTSLGA